MIFRHAANVVQVVLNVNKMFENDVVNERTSLVYSYHLVKNKARRQSISNVHIFQYSIAISDIEYQKKVWKQVFFSGAHFYRVLFYVIRNRFFE